MRLLICIALALLPFVQASDKEKDGDITAKDANEYFDYILAGPLTKEKKFTKLKKSDMPKVSLHLKTDGKDIRVEMVDGKLTDDNTIERMKDCEVKHGNKEKTAVSCTLDLLDMVVNYLIKMEVDDEEGHYDGTAHMKVDFSASEGRVKFEVHKKDRTSHVKKFDIHMQAESGMTTELDDFTGDAEKVLDKKIKRKILRKMEEKVREYLRKLMEEIFKSAIQKSPHRIKDSFKILKADHDM